MVRPYLPLTALRAFEASARHLSFTRAAIELCVTQGAVSHQVKALERTLGTALFERLPRGLMLTREGEMLLQSLISTPEEVDRAANRQRELEQLVLAAGGITGPGSIGTGEEAGAEASEGVAVG